MTVTAGPDIRWAKLADVDPELWTAMLRRARPPDVEDRAHRQRELHVRAR